MKTTLRTACAGALGTAILVALGAYAAQSINTGTSRASSSKASALPAPASSGKRLLMSTGAPTPIGYDRFIVKLRPGVARDASTLLRSLNAASVGASSAFARGAALPGFTPVRAMATGAQVVRASRRLSAAEANALLAQLRNDPAVLYAQPDTMKYALDVTPNDPQFSLQWDYTDATGGIRAPAAWDVSKGDGVVVAVLDTGYTDHRDLVANVVPGYDFISYYGQTTPDGIYPDVAGDGDGRDPDAHDPGSWVDASMSAWCGLAPEPSSWHGTHVAGTVAAVTNNGVDVAGVANQARVQPVRVLGHCGGTTSDIADGIVWASGGHVDGVPDNTNPAEVINMSLGGAGSCASDPATQDAIDGAIARGVTVVVAAGNNNQDAANYSPSSCKGVIVVGATGIDGAKSWFSNYGSTVTIAAPGGNATTSSDPNDRWIWSTGNNGATVPGQDVLMGMIGTSQASPHVAGTVALMQSAAVAAGKSPLTPDQIKQLLRSTARPFPVAPPATTPIGAGILDAAAATTAATQDIPAETAEPLVNNTPVTKLTGAAGDTLLYSLQVPAGAHTLNLRTYGGTGNVSLYVSRDVFPSQDAHQYASNKPGNTEAVVVANPAAGTWYVRIVGESGFANVSLLGLYR